MVSVCAEWQQCMQKELTTDRLMILGTDMLIQGNVFSTFINGFIDPLSWKSVLVFSVWLCIGALVIVEGFKYCKREVYYH